MAKLNIAERRLPQDGRIKLRMLGREVDLRVSTLPTLYGESVVLRILDRSSIVVSLESLGFPTDTLGLFDTLITKPYGLILVTGPTGSGKTTTLYGALDKINSPDKKIITIEDPVEYQLSGVNQIHVKPQIGLTFASGLRSIVRQDPDVIMIGEIRDYETAEIAIQSALTGHLVFSTLHTNDAPSAITRLVDMGIEPFLVGSSLVAVLAQRLVRVLCTGCLLGEQQQLRPIPKTRLYQLNHRQGQVVMEVNPQTVALDYHRLWIRGGDQVFETLSAPENRFKEVVVSGVFREYLPTAGTLDLATVSVVEQ